MNFPAIRSFDRKNLQLKIKDGAGSPFFCPQITFWHDPTNQWWEVPSHDAEVLFPAGVNLTKYTGDTGSLAFILWHI